MKKSFQFKTLFCLLLSFVVAGAWLLPCYFFSQRYDAQHPAPYNFPIAVNAGFDEPSIVQYADFAHDADISLIWKENTQFPFDTFNGEIKPLAQHSYELIFENTLYTVRYRYQIDEKESKVMPLSAQTSGWLIWIYALGYLVVATVLVTVAQWLKFWWNIKFREE